MPPRRGRRAGSGRIRLSDSNRKGEQQVTSTDELQLAAVRKIEALTNRIAALEGELAKARGITKAAVVSEADNTVAGAIKRSLQNPTPDRPLPGTKQGLFR
jgi:hypothetical protein